MKKFTLVGAVMVLTMSAGSAWAENSLHVGAMGLNVTTTRDDLLISGKYFIEKDTAILGGFGLGIAGGTAPNKGTDIGFLVGMRKYLKTSDFAPFVGGRFQYTTTRDSTFTDLFIAAEAGAEYFVGKQFSIEGRVDFGYRSTEIDSLTPFVPTTKDTNFGSGAAALSANFYF
ncbi:MAG: hypothetical protein ABL860_07215 [Candidatus Nitrotoga sp.]